MAVAGYTFSLTANNNTILTYSTSDGESTIWGFNGAVQCRATSLGSAASTEYRVSSAGVQDVVIPYSEIISFAGPESPTNDPVEDFRLFIESFPTFNPIP